MILEGSILTPDPPVMRIGVGSPWAKDYHLAFKTDDQEQLLKQTAVHGKRIVVVGQIDESKDYYVQRFNVELWQWV